MAKNDAETFSKELLDQLLAGRDPKTVLDSGGLIGDLKKALAERMLNAEMDVHLEQEAEAGRQNHRNGTSPKTVLTPEGSLDLSIPRDRHGRFDPALRLFDARGADRFRGENETLDPVGGHIPGACSAPYAGNLDENGRMLPPAALRARFEELLAGTPAEEAIFYCGSGVTAAHTVLALELIGVDAALYAGSWSDWITDPGRPVATGE